MLFITNKIDNTYIILPIIVDALYKHLVCFFKPKYLRPLRNRQITNGVDKSRAKDSKHP